METAVLKPKTPEALQQNILATYFWMRGGIIVLAALLPVTLVLYSVAAHGTLTENSISAYYGADNGVMRNDFVASLCVVGALLIVYKGFSLLENILLKVAGTAVTLVALIPCDCWHPVDSHSALHTAFAITFFACMAVDVEFCGFDTITLLPTQAQQQRYRRYYHTIAACLLVSPVAALAAAYIASVPKSAIFFVEWFGVWMFALYWAVKSREFHYTAAEERAAKGELEKAPHGLVPRRGLVGTQRH